MSAVAKNDRHSSDHALAGATSGFVTRFICQPLDVVKIRFQLQVEPISHDGVSKYRSMLQAFLLILREEGVHALWKGHVPAQLLSVVFGMAQFYSYNVFVELSKDVPLLSEWKYSTKFIAGSTAGIVATVVSFPFDTVRTRLIAQSTNQQVYKGVVHSCSCILRESPRVFFFGLTPTVLQIAPHTGLQFAFYNFFADFYKKRYHENEMSFLNSMLAGSAAGLLAKTAVYPFDLSRKRMQIQGFEHGRKGFGKFFRCTGLIHCFKLTFELEGVRGLFKGLVPSQIKAACTTALHFTVYEQALLILRSLH